MKNRFQFKRKRLIVFSFEGKNNKTESMYFSHFEAKNKDYIIKLFSSGVTDPIKMIRETKRKRKEYDYNASEDLTYIFIDGDCKKEKIKQVIDIKKKLPKDIIIILSNPCFELWFLNHYIKTTKNYLSSKELVIDLTKHIKEYTKSLDVYPLIINKMNDAISNSEFQATSDSTESKTEVYHLFDNVIIEKRKR